MVVVRGRKIKNEFWVLYILDAALVTRCVSGVDDKRFKTERPFKTALRFVSRRFHHATETLASPAAL